MPTSPLQFYMGWVSMKVALPLNELWHSRMPEFTSPPEKCKAIAAEHEGVYFAAAIWSPPVARKLNWTGRYELRRFAIAPDAPRNTASRMLRVMRLLITRDIPDVEILMSYQDLDSHTGAIYRAAGWEKVAENAVPEEGWQSRDGRAAAQSNATKVRWECRIRCNDIGERTK